MAAWLYILKCADSSYYTGSTTNLPLRLAQHHAGEGSDYTRHRLPIKLPIHKNFQLNMTHSYANGKSKDGHEPRRKR